ncbi:hypothetical protein P3T23_004508 [Paraburkholderia sp. GAS448]|uniref:hypothetical protein n=1 Tax=Paraburkholderia sp. GAS448 TaxID=3035136 RepID=UPI003D198C38
MATRRRAARAVQQQQATPATEDAPQDVAQLTVSGHVNEAIAQIEAAGPQTDGEVNALGYLKQARRWLTKDNQEDEQS